MILKLDKELKVLLLKAVNVGELDTDILPMNTKEKAMTLEDIANETVRLQKSCKDELEQEALLMLSFARSEISATEYSAALAELWNKTTSTDKRTNDTND